MNIRHAFILAIASVLFLTGCATTPEERQIKVLMQDPSWPRIQQVAQSEVKKREVMWPDVATYLPVEHKDKVWSVEAMSGTPNGNMQREVMLMIGDDGSVLAYKRYWMGQNDWPQEGPSVPRK